MGDRLRDLYNVRVPSRAILNRCPPKRVIGLILEDLDLLSLREACENLETFKDDPLDSYYWICIQMAIIRYHLETDQKLNKMLHSQIANDGMEDTVDHVWTVMQRLEL